MAARDSAARATKLQQFEVTSVEKLDEAKELGRGCYGAVYEVRLHGLPCIAKRLLDILVGRGKEERVDDDQRKAVIDRFRDECELLSGLSHPNVVQFMGVHYGREEADISLIMEYMHMDLDQCMKTYPNIPLPYKTSILRDVAYGLAYLHSIPIIHRDLNARNVLLTESLRAKIADLGVAKLFDRKTAMVYTRTKCPGAQDFMPPECFNESPKYDAQLDIFSFGHLAIFLVNQEAPVVVEHRMTPADVEKKQIQIGRRRRSLDKMGGPGHPLYSISVQCLNDTPDQRPTSRDLVRSMEEMCEKHPLSYGNCLQTLTELTAKDQENSGELKTLVDVYKQKLEALENELAISQNQANKEKEAIYVELQRVKEKSADYDMWIEQLEEDHRTQILGYKKQIDIYKKDLEESQTLNFRGSNTDLTKLNDPVADASLTPSTSQSGLHKLSKHSSTEKMREDTARMRTIPAAAAAAVLEPTPVESQNSFIVVLRRHDKTPFGFGVKDGADKPEQVYVRKVEREGIAAAEGSLRKDDQLLAVNNVKLEGMPYQNVLSLLRNSGDTLRLLVTRRCNTVVN